MINDISRIKSVPDPKALMTSPINPLNHIYDDIICASSTAKPLSYQSLARGTRRTGARQAHAGVCMQGFQPPTSGPAYEGSARECEGEPRGWNGQRALSHQDELDKHG